MPEDRTSVDRRGLLRHPKRTGTINETVSCRAIATSGDDELHILRFELRNRGDAAIALPAHQPFTEFSVLAAGEDGKPLTVHRPALDIGVDSVGVCLAAGGAATLRTPVRLRIAEDAEPGDDGFIWTIAHRREDLSIRIRLDLPPPFALTCPLRFE